MTEITRESLAQRIATRLDAEMDGLSLQWTQTPPINHFILDDLLDQETAAELHARFPSPASMMLRQTLRERKFIAAQMDRYHSLLEEGLYAFQMNEVVTRVEKITGLRTLEPDSKLYAGGISLMARDHFLCPHIDNSHDMARRRYRVLNLLYYVSPDWTLQDGGALEIWPHGPRGKPKTIPSKFNRLVVMVTHQRSWHSVSTVLASRPRCCISNYYFSPKPVGSVPYSHATSFRAWRHQPVRDLVLRMDTSLRRGIRALFPAGIGRSRHYYDRQHDK